MSDQDHRRVSERRPVALQVRLAFGDVGEFVERYAINISDGGIFIRSREPRPVGSKLRFELHLRTGEVVFAGVGTVRWRQTPDARGLGTAGMGLQFDELTDESRQVLNDILQAREDEMVPPPVEGALPSAWAPFEGASIREPTPPAVAPVTAPPVLAPGATREATPPPVIHVDLETTPPSVAKLRPRPSVGALGIDFGWGSVRAAVSTADRAKIVRLSPQGGLPAFVALQDGQLIVGEAAQQAIEAGAPGVRGIVQLLGRWPGSPGAAAWRRRQLAEPVAGEDGRLAVRLGGKVFSPGHLVELMLREVKRVAEAQVGTPLSRAAFAVPTSWTDAQRHVLREAAEAAGLEVDQFVSTSLAAQLACHGPRGERRSLSVHWGEGALEAAVVEQTGHVFDLITATGDPNLGGSDFDVQLVESVLAQFEKETGLLVPEDPSLFERVRAAAAQAKEALSDHLDTELVVPSLVQAGLSKADVHQKVSRARFLALTTPIIESAVDVVRATMLSKSLSSKDLSELLLFGGQARLTPFHRKLGDRIGVEPLRPECTDDAPALGAALVADGSGKIGRFVLVGAVGASVGYGLPGGAMKRVMERNLPLPVERGYTISTAVPGQREIELYVFQGERPQAFENEYLGTVIVGPLAPVARGDVRVTLTSAMDASGELSFRARDIGSGKPVTVIFNRNRPPEAAKRALMAKAAG